MTARAPRIVAAVLVLAAALQLAAYWPGIMYWDAVRQYGQAVSGAFDDWHPPAMEWVWRQMIALRPGPAPMLLLQAGLYWLGFALLVARAQRRWLIVLVALLPFALATLGSVLKDSLMAGALLAAAGLAAWAGREGRWGLRIAAIALLLFAATLRFNALLAALPLLVAVLPAHWRRTPARWAVCTLVGGLALAVAMPLANHAIGAKPSGVALSLVIFDLGGITEHGSVDAFPPLPVASPVAVNHRCYDPVRWDSYAWWVAEPCPIGFALIRDTFAAHHQSPYVFWLEAIAAHPIAYAEHRLRHANQNMRFVIGHEFERPVQPQSAPNDWGYRIAQNPLQRALDWLAVQTCRTPLGWPICWIALALGMVFASRGVPGMAMPLALSAALYGGGYLVLSVASDLRYHLWTMLAAGLAVAFLVDAGVPRRRLVLAALPAIGVALIGTAARLLW
ncbi:hypothetical protein AWL63_21260 [Sphingomonas panacis]|uniref:Glycosyltransferase RgtA/B/C/D-like domain-containing protein n=1 Tax=Sphingomonas panacis TaxID=1560345 RepID=A0A1B3ZHU0_9SPHN|nr:hypothetical protein AWL63_21260 [Sphingomonas panacis]